MPALALALALAALPVPAMTQPAAMSVATLPERDSAFATLAECEQSLVPANESAGAALAPGQGTPRGSLFNRTAGNTSRCEMVDGEPLIIVTPKAY